MKHTVVIMKLSCIFGIWGAGDKPKDSYGGSVYSFLGRSTSGINVNEQMDMQTTTVYSCVRILLSFTWHGQSR